jgi:hypothetical protein
MGVAAVKTNMRGRIQKLATDAAKVGVHALGMPAFTPARHSYIPVHPSLSAPASRDIRTSLYIKRRTAGLRRPFCLQQVSA